MLRTIAAVLAAVLYLVLSIPVLGIEYLIGKKDKAKADMQSLRMVQWIFRVIYKICGTKVTVIGHDKVPRDQAVLYICNHQSYFDIIIGYSLCPGLTGYIAKDSIEKIPSLNTWMRRLYCLFMKQDDPRAGMKTIQQAIQYVKNGISMCIFPEGHRGDGITLQTFKEGSLRIAEKTNCPVIPMTICNTRNIILNHMPIVKPTHVIIEYGDPIYPAELPKEERKHMAAACQEIIQATLDRNKALI